MTSDDFDTDGFHQALERHWHHHAMCNLISVQTTFSPILQMWCVEASPVFQEIVGGSEDGAKVWSGFEFYPTDFADEEPEVEVESVALATYCVHCSNSPFARLSGRFKGLPFLLRIYLEPIPNTEPVEIYDAITKEVRPKESNHERP